ncbi:MAG: tetratricopeptide repeat protein, partial [Myxococcales bacterium]|nr:tetratricopeptide repeat protein [Myxococcales bacterium]
MGSLERLAGSLDCWSEVTRLYDVEIERMQQESPDEIIELALRVAQVYEQEVGDIDSAIERYRMVVGVDEAHVEGIVALDRLYQATERWPELAEILVKELAIAPSADEILALQFRLGQVQQHYLGDVDAALEQYREILGAEPEHSSALSALEMLFAEGIRPLAIGEILEPLYRVQEQWDRLLNVHVVQLEYQAEPFERISMMHRIAEIAEERVGDHQLAFEWMQRALLEDPAHDHTLSEVERLGAVLDGWVQLASTYADALVDGVQPESKVVVGKRLARVYEEELGDVARAEASYRYVLGVDTKDEESLQALDRIYSENGASQALAFVLEMRIPAADLPDDQVDLSFRLGQLLEHELERVQDAIAVYDRVLADLEPEHLESIQALGDIYTRLQDWPKLLGTFAREAEVVVGDTPRAEVLARMARIAFEQLGDPAKAIDYWKQVLELRGEDPEALSALGDVYASQENWQDLVEILDREVSIADADGLQLAIYTDLARIWYEKLGRDRNALENWERVLDIEPANLVALRSIAEIYRAGHQHSELVDTLHRTIEVATAILEESEVEHIYMQLGYLYDHELQQPMDSVEAYQKAVEVNPANFEALNAIEHIHRREEQWEDAIGVMEQRVQALEDPADRITQLLTVAAAWADKVQERDRGTSAYQRVLELDPLHEAAFVQLEDLHRAAERWEDLVEMYLTRTESVEDVDESIDLLRRIAVVYETQLQDP